MPYTFYGPYSAKDLTFAPTVSSNANLGPRPLGWRLVLPDERGYRFALNDGTVEVAGNLYQSIASVAGHVDDPVAVAVAAGDTQVNATLNATAAAIDIYAEGIVHVDAAPGEGYAYRIARATTSGAAHAAATSTETLTVNLDPDESVQIALTTDSDVTFTRNRFHQILITAAPPTAGLAGISPGVCAADRFYYSQVSGAAAVLADGNMLEGKMVQASITTAGSVESYKRRVNTGGTTQSVLTTAVTLDLLDQDGVVSTLMGVGIASAGGGTNVDITGGIAFNGPMVGMTLKDNDSTEYCLVDLTQLGW